MAFDIERARADGLSEEEIQAAIAYGKSLENIEQPTQQLTQQPTQQPTDSTERAGFFESAFGALGDYFDMSSVGASALLPGGEQPDEAARRYLKEQEGQPPRSRFSYADIEKAFNEGGVEGVKEVIAQLPGGAGEALGMIGPSIAAGAVGFALGGPFGAILALVASSAAPQMGGNVIEQATADLDAGRPLDVDNAKALVTLIPQVALDVIPFKLGALGKLVGLNKKLPADELRKKIAEEGLGKAIAKDFVSIVGQEVPTEIGQEILTKAQAGVDPFSKEAIAEYKELGALVFFTGGLAPITAYRSKQQAKSDIQIAENELNSDTDSSEESTKLKANDIMKEWNKQKNQQQKRKANKDIKSRPRASLNILDTDTLGVMGINEQSAPILYNALLNKSTTTKQGREEIKEIFEANSGNYANVDATAVNSFLKRITKTNDTKAKRFNVRRAGVSPSVSQPESKLDPTDTASVETDERVAVGDSAGDTRGTGDGTSQLNDTLRKKSPLNKNLKPKQKKSLAEIIDNQVVIRKGVVIKQKDGTLALQEDGSNEIITFNENQVINPTKKDQGVLSTIAEESKTKTQKTEEKVEDFIKGPQFAKQPPRSPKLQEIESRLAQLEATARSYDNQENRVPPFVTKQLNAVRQEREDYINQQGPQQELFAKGPIENTQETPDSILQSFINQYGDNINLGVKRGLVNVLKTAADVTPQMLGGQRLPADAQAFYNDGKAYFIADRMTAAEAPSKLLHEIGAHHGLEGMLGKENYKRLVKSLEKKKNTDKDIKAAYDFVEETYPELASIPKRELFIQEVIAKIGEQTPDNTLFRQVVGYIKNFLSKLGMGWNVDNISASEIQDMIQQSLRLSLAKQDKTKLTSQTLQKLMTDDDEDLRAQPITLSKDPSILGDRFYSPLKRVVDEFQDVALAEQWKGYITKKANEQGFKGEIIATDIFDYIDAAANIDKRIPKKIIQQYLDDNRIKIESERVGGALSESEIENYVGERRDEIYRTIRDQGYEQEYINFDYFEEFDRIVEEKGAMIINNPEGNEYRATESDKITKDKFIVLPMRDVNYQFYDNAQGFNNEEDALQARDEFNQQFEEEVEVLLDTRVEDYISDYTSDIMEEAEAGYSNMQRTGGPNTDYAEILKLIDNTALKERIENEAERIVDKGQVYDGMDRRYQIRNVRDALYQDFYNAHYSDYPNVIYHLRYDIRQDVDGKKVMWVEELQSDWAERIRLSTSDSNIKKYGYKRPFINDTQAWMKLAVKDVVREAAELGVDKVAFLSPDQAYNVHSRDRNAADISYGRILPKTVEKVISKLAGSKQKLEIIDLRPGVKPTASETKRYNDLEKELKQIRKKRELSENKPYYRYVDYYSLAPFVKEYAQVLMKETPGINVKFEYKGGDLYSVVRQISEVPFDELEKAKLLANRVAKDPSLVKNDPEINQKLIKSFKDNGSPTLNRHIEFLESNIKIEKLIGEPGGIVERDYMILTAPNSDFRQYTRSTSFIYNADEKLRKEIDKYVPNQNEYEELKRKEGKLFSDIELIKEKYLGLRDEEEENHKAKRRTGKQLGFTMTPQITASALDGQPMFSKKGTENARKLYKESKPEKPSPNQEQKNNDAFEKNMEESPVSWPSRFANAVFSFDNALNSAIRKAMEASNINPELQKKLLTKISLSQALHAESLGDQFVIFGKIEYNPETGKWSAVEGTKNTPSLKKISQSLKTLAKQRGMKLEELRKIAGAAITGKRLRALKKQQTAEIAQAKSEFDKGNKKEAKEILDNLKIIHKTDAEIDAMVKIFDEIPQLNKIYADWLAVRDEAVDALVIAQKLPQSEVDKYKAEIDFVPFYRVQEELNRTGPSSTSKGLIDNRWYKFKGSYEPVNDVFENMEMWSKYSIRRAVLNQAAINKVDATLATLPDMIRQVPNASGANTVSIERLNSSGNIETVHYQFADPTFAAAFGGMEQAQISGLSYASKIANILRANVVLYPLFSIAQLPQDAVSAMFSSGVKYPFMIPLRVLKEFPLTFINASKTHKVLAKVAAVGSFGSYAQTAFDINNRHVKEMGPIRKSIKLLTDTPIAEVNEIPISILGLLNRLAMASDNAVRQAVYEQTMSETNDKALAEERAFEIINFKRGGSSAAITGLRQVVPFFGAALQALSVQGRMLGGKGIAPTKNDGKLLSAATKQFMSTWAQVITATLLYNLLMDDEEEFKKLDPSLRDRRILLGNGYHITLRPDIFTYMAKMVPEQMFQYIFRESEDSQKFVRRLKMGLLDVLGNAPVPQIVRPALELAFNESILTDRPIVPQSTDSELLSGNPEMQAKASTSELAKMLGEASGINPLRIDYFLKQYFGYSMGLGLMLTDEIIADKQFNYERASKSERDMIASIPGMSAFITRQYGNRHTSDYYELKELVSDAYKSYNALETKEWDRSKSNKFYRDYASLIKAQEYIKTKDKIISQIRARRKRILNAPLNFMDAETKRTELEKMNKLEQETLFDISEQRRKVFDDETGKYRRRGQRSNNVFN